MALKNKPWKINGEYPTKDCLNCKTKVKVTSRDRWERTKFCSKKCQYVYIRPSVEVKETDLLKCTICGYIMEAKFFPRDRSRSGVRNGYGYTCSPCKKARPPKTSDKDKRRNWDFLRKYNISLEDYDKILESQNGLCAICRGTETRVSKLYLSVDHNHTTGKVRGLLCYNCNVGLGNFKDDKESLMNAIKYLELEDTPTWL